MHLIPSETISIPCGKVGKVMTNFMNSSSAGSVSDVPVAWESWQKAYGSLFMASSKPKYHLKKKQETKICVYYMERNLPKFYPNVASVLHASGTITPMKWSQVSVTVTAVAFMGYAP